MRCPDEVDLDEVLAGSAAPQRDAAIRAHVAGCERCLAAHGAEFELELWGGALAADPSASRRRSPPRRAIPIRRIASAAAALLLAAAGVATWRQTGAREATAASAAAGVPPAQLLEWAIEVGESGPMGARAVRTEWDPARPDRVRIIEAVQEADGIAWRREWTEHHATTKENGP